MGGRVLHSASVTDNMEKSLNKLHSAGALDDEFFMSMSNDGRMIVTGGYDKSANVIDTQATLNHQVTCKHLVKKGATAGRLQFYNKKKQLTNSPVDGSSPTKRQTFLSGSQPIDSGK